MPPPTPTSPTTFGKYLLIERIATGGMAEVFRAVLRGEAGFEKTLALKRILPVFNEETDFVALFQDEARIASTLTHANLVQTFDFGLIDGSYYLALEVVEGTDLAKLLERLRAVGQPFPTATAAFLVAEAARGLAYAHDKKGPDGQSLGIVHRDVSPQNILLSYAGEVKIADFGIAKAASKVHRTGTGMVMGKLRYMSPEQVAGDPLDARSDVFSLGVILYELLTGGPLFPEVGASVAELIHGATIVPPSGRVPGMPQALDEIVARALGRPRDRRYAKASDLARDLSVWVNQASPGFTREDLGALVLRIMPPPASERGRTTLGVGAPMPTPPTAVVRGGGVDVVATAAMRRPGASTPPATSVDVGSADTLASGAGAGLDAGVPAPLGARRVAGDPSTDPRAPTLARQLDIATRTRSPGAAADPAFARGDTFVRGDTDLAGGTRSDPAMAGRPFDDPAPTRRRAGRSSFGWIAGVLIAVILGSAALVLGRFMWPARDDGATARAGASGGATVDADLGATDAAADADTDADADPALETDAAAELAALPFTLVASLTDARAREALASRVSDARVTRKGVADADYELFLSGLDARLATLELDGDGRPGPPGPLPPTLALALDARGLGEALAGVVDYVRQTGELPGPVRAALLRFLRGRPAFDPRGDLRAATLAVWLDVAARPARLVEQARQNWATGGFCAVPEPPRRHFAPLACEAEALVLALVEAGQSADAEALARWAAAGVDRVQAGDVSLTLLAAQWEPRAGHGARAVRVQARVLGLERPPATAFQVLAGGVDGALAATLSLPPAPGADAGAPGFSSGPPLVFVVPEGAYAAVLRVSLPGGELIVRLPAPSP